MQPLVSCLCVSRHRPRLLVRSLECFRSQSYPNTECVVVHPVRDTETRDCVAAFNDSRIRSIGVDAAEISLGELRNISIDAARGEYLCVWDDDDWHSPERIAAAYSSIQASRKHASILTRVLIYDSRAGVAYLGYERLWENTTFVAKSKLTELGIRYPALDRTEDYHFVNLLIEHNLVYPMNDPTLYVYNITGSNSCSATHFDGLLRRSVALTAGQSAIVGRSIGFVDQPCIAHELMQSFEFKSPLRYVRASAVPRP